MVKVINLRDEEKKIVRGLHRDELLEIIKKELPDYECQNNKQLLFPHIVLYKDNISNDVATFSLFSNSPCFTIKDKKLENIVIEIAKQYERMVKKEVRVNLDYKE